MTKEITKNAEQISALDADLHAFKLRKAEIKLQLKQLYVDMLKNEEHIL